MYEIYCQLRDSRNLKDSDVARATNITKSTFSDWKSGRSKPKNDKLQKIADFFEVSVEYLLNGTEQSFEYNLKKGDFMNTVERIKSLCEDKKIAISKLEKDLGFGNGYIGQLKKGVVPNDRLKSIADYLNVSMDYLVTGKETTANLSKKDELDIQKRLEMTLTDLENSQEALMFSGEPLDDETRELLKASLENSIRIAKINAKKFTPKKYRED